MKTNRKIDRQVSTIYRKIGEGVQVPIMSLSTIMKAGETALLAGESLAVAEARMQEALDAVRV